MPRGWWVLVLSRPNGGRVGRRGGRRGAVKGSARAALPHPGFIDSYIRNLFMICFPTLGVPSHLLFGGRGRAVFACL